MAIYFDHIHSPLSSFVLLPLLFSFSSAVDAVMSKGGSPNSLCSQWGVRVVCKIKTRYARQLEEWVASMKHPIGKALGSVLRGQCWSHNAGGQERFQPEPLT